MSARLLKNGPQSRQTVLAPFIFPARVMTNSPDHISLNRAVGKQAVVQANDSLQTGEVTAPIEDAESETEEILVAARAEANRLIAEAQSGMAQLEREASERGEQEARARMTDELNAAVADLRDQLAHSLTELEQLYSLMATRTEHDLVKLALEVARKVIHREVTIDPEISLTLVRVAIARLHPRASATVRLHPEDFSYVDARLETSAAGCRIEIIADTTVGRGGCIVQSEHGDIDARIEQQFATIERGFFEG